MKAINSILDVRNLFAQKDDRVYFNIQSSAQKLRLYFEEYLRGSGKTFQKHPSYRNICDWLSDNKGKGLIMYGSCSQGKTVLAKYVIPNILSADLHKIVTYYPMVDANRNPDEVKRHKIIVLDDVGTEEEFKEYGNKRNSFCEIMDAVEQQSKLAIITTNLTMDEIEARYGLRTLERIVETCKPVCFSMCKCHYECNKLRKLGEIACDECDDFESASFRGNL